MAMPVFKGFTRHFVQGCAALAVAAAAVPAAAQDAYPSRPLRFVVPFPPGGLTDVLGRAVAERLGKAVGQPAVVENRPGAGTLVGAQAVATSPADGYTLLISTSTTFGIAPALFGQKASVDPVRELQPVTLIGTVNFFLVGSPQFQPKTLREMIDTVKANPGKYYYGSVGNGSAHHLFMEDLKRRAGLDIQHVPYKGTPAAFLDLIPGKIQVMFSDAAVALPQIRAGKVVPYGTSAAKQNTLLAEVPPVAQTVPGFDWQAWQGVSVPKATPPQVVQRLSTELLKIQQAPEFQAFLAKIGMEPWAPITPAQFGAMVQDEVGRWAEAVRVSGAKVD